MGDGNFRPPQNPHPLIDHQKIGTGDYVGGHYGCAKFGANPSMGASGQMGEIIIMKFFLFIPFFHELTYRSDAMTDFHA